MKSNHKKPLPSSALRKKQLTFGDLVVATYDAYNNRMAKKILQFAINSQIVRFERPQGHLPI
jgi:hypothetical protein